MLLLLLLIMCVIGLILAVVLALLAGREHWTPWTHTACIWFVLLMILIGYRWPALMVMK